MITIQCDKNLKNIVEKIFIKLDTNTKISELSKNETDICILRERSDINPNSKILIVNSDNKNLLKNISGYTGKIISCGLSTRATVTFSSITEQGFVLCVQRSLTRLDGSILSPFELPIVLEDIFYDETSMLMMITTALICGANASQLKNIKL